MASRGSAYRWNDALGRYIGADGRMVTGGRVRAELDRALAKADARIRWFGTQLQSGAIELEEWRLDMRLLLRNVHLYSAASARGGWAQMSDAAYGQVGGILRQQYAYLDRFALQISKGLPLDGSFLRRVALYTQAARGTYQRALRDVKQARGFDEERNVLDDGARHCVGPRSCPGQRALGWVAIGTLIPIGQRACGVSCQCRIIYRRSKEAAA